MQEVHCLPSREFVLTATDTIYNRSEGSQTTDAGTPRAQERIAIF